MKASIAFLLLAGLKILACSSGEGRHTLFAYATNIVGETQFPQFTLVLYVDGIPVNYAYNNEYGSISIVDKGHNKTVDLPQERIPGAVHRMLEAFGFIYKTMVARTEHLSPSSSEKVNVYQKQAGCVKEQDRSWMESSEAFNEAVCEKICPNKQLSHYNKYSYEVNSEWGMVGKLNDTQDPTQPHSDIYVQWLPDCIAILDFNLEREEGRINRTNRPIVNMSHKTLSGYGESVITCLATGFYPASPIKITLLRDGRPVPETQITGGESLPNGDETYQMRKSLKVSLVELYGYKYTCTVQHPSLDQELRVVLELDNRFIGRYCLGILGGILVIVAVAVCWKKLKAGHSTMTLQAGSSSTREQDGEKDKEQAIELTDAVEVSTQLS